MIKDFLTANSGRQNAIALQKELDKGGKIVIDVPGEYALADTLYIGGNTELIFGEGVIIRRESCLPFNGNALINRGAFTGRSDENITVTGLTLLVNKVESTPASEECDKTVVGLRGHLSFLYVKGLTLKNITVTGLERKDYGIQICNFENVKVDGVYIEGKKDGIHFGPGSGFVLKNAVFKTADDPIALNADDYSVSNPTLGVIENGLIENCTDLYEEINDGFFARILSGAWGDWYPGIKVRHSDSVVYRNSLYRVVMSPSWEEYISYDPPAFESGFQTINGIRWAKTGYEPVYEACVRNITFKNITLKKARWAAVAFWLEQNEYRRGLFDGAALPKNGSFVFENIHVEADIRYPIAVYTPVESITVSRCDFAKGKLIVSNENQARLNCPELKMTLKDNSFSKNDIVIQNRTVLFEDQ